MENRLTEKLRTRWYTQKSRARKMGVDNTWTLEEFAEALNDANGVCAICGKYIGYDALEIDHIVPMFLGGTHTKDNIQMACMLCNRSKDSRYTTAPGEAPEVPKALLEDNRIVTVKEASKIIGLSYSSLAQAVRDGRVKARKSEGTWLIQTDDLRLAIKERSIRPRKPPVQRALRSFRNR